MNIYANKNYWMIGGTFFAALFIAMLFLVQPVLGRLLPTGYIGGELVMSAAGTEVYFVNVDGFRYVFPNERVYFSWYENFERVRHVSGYELASIPLGGVVRYRPATRLIKVPDDPKVYAVKGGGKVAWITTEELAVELYGTDWNQKIDDMNPSFFVAYEVADPIMEADDFHTDFIRESTPTVSSDIGCGDYAENLETCSSYRCHRPALLPLVATPSYSNIMGMVGDECRVATGVTETANAISVICMYSADDLPAIAEHQRLVDNATSITSRTSVKFGDDGVQTESITTIDGVEYETPWVTACVASE